MTMNYHLMTKEEAGQLTPEQALGLLGRWWYNSEGTDRLESIEGRQELHRVYLRNMYNSDASEIPLHVLRSHVLDPIRFNARCWFAREVYRRTYPE